MESSTNTGSKRLVVLLVDDENSHAELIRLAFASGNDKAEIVIGGSLAEARRLIEEIEPDIVIVDWYLPDGSGAELLPGDKERLPYPFVVMTSYGDHANAVDALKAGALDYVVKSEATMLDMPRIVDRSLREWRHIQNHREAKEALAESVRYHRALMDQSPIGLALCRMNGELVDVNPAYARIIGRTVDDVMQLTYWDITPEKYAKDEQRVLAQLRESGRYGPYEKEYIHKDGHLVPVRLSGMILKRFDESFIWSSVEDITEHVRWETEMLRIQKLESIGVLAGGIAHDFNNVFTAIIGNVSLAELHLDRDSEALDFLKRLRAPFNRARQLTHQLLTFSKGGEPLRSVVVAESMIRTSVGLALSESQTKCRFDFGQSDIRIHVDDAQISQAIQNVVLNADQASNRTGELYVSLTTRTVPEGANLPLAPGNYAVIAIRDHGCGIAAEHVNKIFDPFFTTRDGASGLGLSTAYSIVRSHGGHIVIHSRTGQGTTVEVYLLTTDKELRTSGEHNLGLQCAGGRILVMDDEDYVRDTARAMLSEIGYDVDVAVDGADAIEKYKRAHEADSPYDLVILDLTVPAGMGGQDAVSELLAIDENATALVSSGYSNSPVMGQYEKYGFRGVIKKPYRLVELSVAVYHALVAEAN